MRPRSRSVPSAHSLPRALHTHAEAKPLPLPPITPSSRAAMIYGCERHIFGVVRCICISINISRSNYLCYIVRGGERQHPRESDRKRTNAWTRQPRDGATAREARASVSDEQGLSTTILDILVQAIHTSIIYDYLTLSASNSPQETLYIQSYNLLRHT